MVRPVVVVAVARIACLCFLLVLVLTKATSLVAEDRLTIHGNYYREASTRVLQPLVYIEKDIPDERLTVSAEYMLDAISSASIAAGAAAVTGGDNVFTELRHEATFRIASRIKNWQLGSFFRYSTESDYISRSFGVSLARDVFQRAGTVSISYAYNFDRVFQIRANIRDLLPWTSIGDSNLIQIHYLALTYSHALHRTVLAGVSLEGIHAEGPQDNAYRTTRDARHEAHPLLRRRLAPSGFLRIAIPQAGMVLEPRYRYYSDDWHIQAHAIDPRIHVRFAKYIRLRLRYRFYWQSQAFFWRDDGIYEPDAVYVSADPKMASFHSHTPGIQLTFELEPLARFRGLRWLSGAWIQATYNHVFQTNRFGDARLGSLSFSIPL